MSSGAAVVTGSLVRRLALLGLLLATQAVPGLAAAAGIELRNLLLREEARHVVLDASLEVQLSAAADEALSRGVPLTLEITTRLVRPRWWWWDAQEHEVVSQVSLRYHALSRRYVVGREAGGLVDAVQERRVFFRRDAAMRAWGEVTGISIVRAYRLADGVERYVDVRARLSLEALPHPLRTVAYVSPEWRIVSEWRRLELP
jgi:hypothetical protein